MFPMLAEIAEKAADKITAGQFVTGICVLGTAFLIPLLGTIIKARSDSAKLKMVADRETRNDEIQHTFLKSIAETNVQIAKNQESMNILLATEMGVQKERHNTNQIIMQNLCKAVCPNHQSAQPQKTAGAA